MKRKIIETENGYKYKTYWKEGITIFFTVVSIMFLFFLICIM